MGELIPPSGVWHNPSKITFVERLQIMQNRLRIELGTKIQKNVVKFAYAGKKY